MLKTLLLFAQLALTPAPHGPYTVAGNRLLDAAGVPFLIRGTRLAPLTSDPADIEGDAKHSGALSTAPVRIRQRLNMNAVRRPRSYRNRLRDQFVRGFSLTPRNRADPVEFLRSLTDETPIHNPAFSDPC